LGAVGFHNSCFHDLAEVGLLEVQEAAAGDGLENLFTAKSVEEALSATKGVKETLSAVKGVGEALSVADRVYDADVN
jgi:hypothetical protein